MPFNPVKKLKLIYTHKPYFPNYWSKLLGFIKFQRHASTNQDVYFKLKVAPEALVHS